MSLDNILSAIDAEISLLQQVRSILTGVSKGNQPSKPGRKPISAEGRRRIAAAQRKRWAAARRAAK